MRDVRTQPIRLQAAAYAAMLATLCVHGYSAPAPNPAARPDTLALTPAYARPLPQPPAAAKTVITPNDVDRQLGNLGDLLQRIAGLHVLRTGGVGDYLGISIRGASESQTRVYVNGVLQDQAVDPSLFLSSWDMSRVDRIEVYKGLAPDNLPGAAMGGAINIITRDGSGAVRPRLALGAGSFGSLKANGSAGFASGAWSGRAEAARDQAKGDFPYADDNGMEYKPGRNPNGSEKLGEDDLVHKIRANNAHGFTDLGANLSWRPGPLELGLQADAFHLRKQIPAPFPRLDTTVRVSAFRESDRFFMRGGGRWAAGDNEASLDVSGNWLNDHYEDKSKAGGVIGIGYDDDDNAYADGLATLWGRAGLGNGFTLSGLASYGVSTWFYTDRVVGRGYPGLFRYTGEGKLTPTWTRGEHTLQAILHAALTLQEHYADRQFGYGGKLVPNQERGRDAGLRLGYQWRFAEGYWLSAQGGNAWRQPTFQEKFGDRGFIIANPVLRNETGINGSLGAHAEGRGWSAELQGFASETENLITLTQNSQFVLVYRNTDRAQVMGAEARLAATPRDWTRSEFDFTAQRAVNATSGALYGEDKYLPYRPVLQASLRQLVTRWNWSLATTGYWQGRAYPNPSNLPSLFDAYSHNTAWQARCDLDLSWRTRRFLLAAGARNLFNQPAFDFFYIPLPGRSFAATVQAEL